MKIGVFCGERWYSPRSWRRYPLFHVYAGGGFSIGPILFWDGS